MRRLLVLPVILFAACSSTPDCPEGQVVGARGNCVPAPVFADARPSTDDASVTTNDDAAVNPTDDAAVANDDAAVNPTDDAALPNDDAAVNPTDDAAEGTDAAELTADALPSDIGGGGSASLAVNALDLGRIVVGSRGTRTVRVSNTSGQAQIVRAPTLAGANAGDFSVVVTATLAAGQVTLQPGDGFDIRVTLAPSAIGARAATITISLCDSGCAGTVMLTGEGLATAIRCAPPAIDFGTVNPTSCQTQALICTNASSYDATVVGIAFAAGASSEYGLTISPSLPAQLTANATVSATVRYCPTNLGRDATQIAVTIIHPTPASTTQLYDVAGVGGGPNISCTPPSMVSFGLVAVGQMQTRRVTCRNTGNVPLLISSAGLSAGTTSDLTLAVTVGGASIALPNTIAANASVDLDLRFNPSMPASHMTTLTIASNDPDSPSTAITVSADAIAAGNCTVSIAPLTLDFGAVSPGSSVVARTRVTNTGAGSCAVNVVGLTAGGSPAFSLVSGPSSNVLNPAEVLFVDVRFAPATTGVVNATLELQTSDGARPSPTVALTGNGVSLAGSLVIVPDHLDFGAVPSACATGNSKRFDIYNTSGAPLSLTAVAMEMGSDPGFIVTAGALPVAIPVGGSAPVTVTFAPASAAAFIGRVRLSVAGLPAVFVPVSGRGGSAGTVTETFPASPAALVDVLLMVDDSGSMQPYQTLLANSIGAFIARGDAANADYHITVVTTDASTGIVGTMRGNPAVIDRSRANRVSELQANVQVGTAGAADEQAFRASAVAVTDTVLLAGGNAGFLRPNANLVVVILSDEDDQSPAGTALYVDQLRNRPVGAPSVTIYALSGGPEGCSGPNGSVVDAPRYDEAVTMSGGFHASICDSSFGASMTRIADATFGVGRQRYPLGVQPAPGSVVVRVDGVVRPATTGTITQYGIDYRAPAVQFAPGRAPSTTRAVSIAYTPFCVGATCGNGAPNSGEQCDDGNPSNADICPTTCYSAVCGDGFLRSTGEQCDDGNTIAGDGCNGVCTVEGCGNGVVEPPEVCDSGMNNSDTRANACRTTCVAAFCGDGVGDMGEACDDGNPFDTDACLTGCRAARCGDGAVRTGVEQCDDANANDTDDCRNNCTFNGTGFTITRVNAAFVASPGAALTFAPSNDDGAATVSIGFPFTFLGGAVTNAYVGTNGLVGFTASDTAYQNTPIPDVDTPNGFIALWWDDLRVDLAATPVPTVTSTLTGRTPNRTRIVTYRDVPRYSATPSANNPTISMEIRLHETTNVIDVFYGPLGGGAGNPFSATVGWESPTGGRGADALGCGESCTSVQWPAGSRITYTP